MSTHEGLKFTGHEGVEPEAGQSAGRAADELLSHGLLGLLHQDDEAARETRIRAVMSGLDESGAGLAARAGAARGRAMLRVRRIGAWAAAAAAVVTIATVTLLAVPQEATASALVQGSLATMRDGESRRYEVRLMPRGETTVRESVHATVDTGANGQLLMQLTNPRGGTVYVGRDAQGKWAIRRDGGIEREHPERAWPKWAEADGDMLFADSVDDLLERMTRQYELQREDAGADGSTQHIVGIKKQARGPGPGRMEVWIARGTRQVERIALYWDEADLRRPIDRPPPFALDGPPPRPPHMRPGDGRGPDDRPMRPRRGDRPDRPPHGDRDGNPRPDRPAINEGFEPGDGPPMDDPMLDGPPGGPERGAFGPGRPPRGRIGDGMGPGPEGRGPEGRGPEGRGPEGRRMSPPPPRAIVFDRVDAPEHPDGWFSPDSHLQNDEDGGETDQVAPPSP